MVAINKQSHELRLMDLVDGLMTNKSPLYDTGKFFNQLMDCGLMVLTIRCRVFTERIHFYFNFGFGNFFFYALG